MPQETPEERDLRLPQALNAYEYVADGITVLLFAIGVLGRIAYPPEDL